MTNGAERPAEATPSPASSAPTGPTMPVYRAPIDRGVPKLARGIVWSDLVREMEVEQAARLSQAAEHVRALRRGRYDDGIEEAA